MRFRIRVASLAIAAATLAAGRYAAAADGWGSARGLDEVRRALDESADGRVYVLVALRNDYVVTREGVRLASVRERQRAVLDDMADGGFQAVYRYENIPALTGRAGRAGVERLSAHPLVETVGLDGRARLALRESRAYIRADRVQETLGLTGEGAIVAVLDTGIDLGHPDLADDIVEGAYHFLEHGSDVGPGMTGSLTHGTFVAGIITSRGVVAPVGIAPDAGILAVQVTPELYIWTSDAAAAIDYVIGRRLDGEPIVAMNMSFYVDDPPATPFTDCPCDDAIAYNRILQAGILAAKEAGIITFVASGNEGRCDAMFSPACLSSSVAVGAVLDRLPDRMAGFTTRSACLDILAPGSSIVSSLPNASSGEWGGTSFATPHASAVAALMAGQCLSPYRIEEILKETGRPFSVGCNPDRKVPIIDAFAAVSAALAEPQGACGPPALFIRGDANADTVWDIGDAIFVLDYLFGGGSVDCLDAADANDDGRMDLADPIGLLTYLFADGPMPPAPALACGRDPTGDTLSCRAYPPCR